jgi:hypothetical protein
MNQWIWLKFGCTTQPFAVRLNIAGGESNLARLDWFAFLRIE